MRVSERSLLSSVQLFVTPWTIQSMEFSKPEYLVGSLSLLQGIFPTQKLNWGLLHCRWILYQLNYQGVRLFCIDLMLKSPEESFLKTADAWALPLKSGLIILGGA